VWWRRLRGRSGASSTVSGDACQVAILTNPQKPSDGRSYQWGACQQELDIQMPNL
jgi:hypothetical protein